MMKATIHLNGTAARDLMDSYTDAINALREAERALCECGPNGRDHYPQ
jgi:hypothetical protein